MNFFFDNTFAKPLSDYIKALVKNEKYSYGIYHLRDKFPQNTKDVDWINQLSNEGDWIILSGDISQTRKPPERMAIQGSGLTTFYFYKQFPQHNRWEQSWKTIKVWPEIVKFAEKKPKGGIFTIQNNLKIK